ncbi:hypothetical protein D3C86_1607110 [compost metagenome]
MLRHKETRGIQLKGNILTFKSHNHVGYGDIIDLRKLACGRQSRQQLRCLIRWRCHNDTVYDLTMTILKDDLRLSPCNAAHRDNPNTWT